MRARVYVSVRAYVCVTACACVRVHDVLHVVRLIVRATVQAVPVFAQVTRSVGLAI